MSPNEDRLLETEKGVIESTETPEQKNKKIREYMDGKGEQQYQKYRIKGFLIQQGE